MLGFQDECWWSRLAQPALHAWTADEPRRLQELAVPKEDPDPKALACYGLLRGDTGGMLLRFVDGRPVSQVTEDFLSWVCVELAREDKKALLLVWDNASWHTSARVRTWIKEHNLQAKREGGGAHRGLSTAEQEPVAQSERAEVGAWQAGHRRTGAVAHGGGGRDAGV